MWRNRLRSGLEPVEPARTAPVCRSVLFGIPASASHESRRPASNAVNQMVPALIVSSNDILIKSFFTLTGHLSARRL
jgi:hypothetical protein